MATTYGILAILLWGSLALLGEITSSIPAFQLLSLCFFISALIIVIKRAYNREVIFKVPSLDRQQWLFGIIGLFGFHFCYFIALKFAPVIEVSLIVYFWPLLLAAFVANKHNLARAIIGGCLGFIGIAFIIIGDGQVLLNDDYIIGYALSICCAIIWSSYSWFLSRSNNDVEDIAWLSAAVALLAFVASISLETPRWDLTINEWSGIILLGLGPVGGAFYLWDIGLKRGNKQVLASLSFSTPLISSIILAIAGISVWSINIITALTLILLGALITNVKVKNKRKRTQFEYY